MPTTQVYTEAGQTAILELQRQGARLVRMRPDGKRPAYKWGGRKGRCLTQRQAESWLRINGRFALVPYSIGFSVLDIDDGPWQDLASVYPPHAVIPSRKLWRRHLYYSDSEPRSNAQKRNLHGYLERLTKPLLEQKARADDGTTYGQESLMYVCPALISNP